MSDSRRRVVITGMGAVTPLGHNVQALWNGIREGRSGITRITQIDPTDFPSQVAGEVKDWNPSDYIDKKEARNMARFTQFAVAAAVEAMADAGFGPHEQGGYNRERVRESRR